MISPPLCRCVVDPAKPLVELDVVDDIDETATESQASSVQNESPQSSVGPVGAMINVEREKGEESEGNARSDSQSATKAQHKHKTRTSLLQSLLPPAKR